MIRYSLVVVVLALFSFPCQLHAQALSWGKNDQGKPVYPKPGKAGGYVLVQGKLDFNKIPYKNMKFVSVFACVNGDFEGIKKQELAIDSNTGVWGGTNGFNVPGPAGTYNPGDKLQVFVFGVDTSNDRKYWLTGSSLSSK
jgi:hypothetical protein